METKKCKRCSASLPISEFYARDTSCKKCRRKCIREYRKRNGERIKAYDRSRGMLPHRVKAREKYQKTKAGKEAVARAKKKWRQSNPDKRAAHIILGNAVRDGRIKKPESCSECGTSEFKIHGHHDDYAKPLEVRWLCSSCHSKWHAKYARNE